MLLNSKLDVSQNGVIRLGDTLIQWGGTSTASTSAVVTIKLKEEFANSGYFVTYSITRNASTVTKSWIGDSGSNDLKTTTSFGIYVNRTTSAYTSTITWLAVGAAKL